jgi:hypothetical protein
MNLKDWGLATAALLATLGSGVGSAQACEIGVDCIEGQPASPASATPAEACEPEIDCIGSVDRACNPTTGSDCDRHQRAPIDRACDPMTGAGCG